MGIQVCCKDLVFIIKVRAFNDDFHITFMFGTIIDAVA